MLNLFKRLKSNDTQQSADVAKERLQILIARKRRSDKHNFLPELEQKILDLVKEYVQIDDEDVEVRLEEDLKSGMEVLELNVNLPDGNKIDLARAQKNKK